MRNKAKIEKEMKSKKRDTRRNRKKKAGRQIFVNAPWGDIKREDLFEWTFKYRTFFG